MTDSLVERFKRRYKNGYVMIPPEFYEEILAALTREEFMTSAAVFSGNRAKELREALPPVDRRRLFGGLAGHRAIEQRLDGR